jgi:TorA maturation chaperone TorD
MNYRNSIDLADIYNLLSLASKYPEKEWLTQGFMTNLLAILREAELEQEADNLAALTDLAPDDLENLQIEYTRLFINAVPGTIAPPFGSIYLHNDRSLYGPSTVKVKDFYRQHGFEIKNPAAIPDELSLELEFLGLLVSQGMEEEEEEFLALYFRPWFKKFSDVVINETTQPFYRAVVRLIDFFTTKEEI